jgi:hypothetical protein
MADDNKDDAAEGGKEYPEFPGEKLSKRYALGASALPSALSTQPRPAPSEYKRRIKAAEKEKADAAKAAEKVSPASLDACYG